MKNKEINTITTGIMTAALCMGIGAACPLRAVAAEDAAQRSILMSGGIQTYLNGIGTVDAAKDHVIITVAAAAALMMPPMGQGLEETSSENEYADLALANVTNYVNVRTEANTGSAIVGKIYDGAVAQILETVEGEDGQWFRIVSGNVEGYIKSEFFLYGDAAAEVIDQYVTRYAVVLADRLNVRENPDIGAKRIGFIDNGERVKLLETGSEWLKVQYTESKSGYVAAEYVTIVEEFVYAKTLEEEAAELAARRALEERQHVSESQAAENTAITAAPPSGEYADTGELRSGIIEYAKQFLGNRYVHGGQSLESGTDCSGFTSLIYAQFGYSVSRTPSGQLANDGRSIAYSEARPGDIICYGSGGKCTHVALYMGDGQIIHSANSRKGVVIYQADYDTIIGVKSIID
ncbi:MAG: C40 family peptidase [Lachnospiraceae bacterium]|nr:C40 family peptidase [Lachnospiraceae bacterium]MCM1241118.1 C40 family peptidase [Lachnospiraceae bacterium]